MENDIVHNDDTRNPIFVGVGVLAGFALLTVGAKKAVAAWKTRRQDKSETTES